MDAEQSNSLDWLQADVDTCLAVLIAQQDSWKPEMKLWLGGGQTRTVPVTLIGLGPRS